MAKRPAGVAQLRQLVRERVDQASIRGVAEEIGMSPSGLHVFLTGSRPHTSTVQKISAWASNRSQDSADQRDIEAAVTLLRAYLDSAATVQLRSSRFANILKRLG